jgi:hypothetical protein
MFADSGDYWMTAAVLGFQTTLGIFAIWRVTIIAGFPTLTAFLGETKEIPAPSAPKIPNDFLAMRTRHHTQL